VCSSQSSNRVSDFNFHNSRSFRPEAVHHTEPHLLELTLNEKVSGSGRMAGAPTASTTPATVIIFLTTTPATTTALYQYPLSYGEFPRRRD